jgi:hypothetical protein
MSTIALAEFDNILNHNPNYLGYDYLFYNIDAFSLLKIKELIQARKISGIVDINVFINSNELRKLEYIISTAKSNISAIEYTILSTYLSTLICKELFNYKLANNKSIERSITPSNVIANDNLKKCENIKEYADAFNKCDSFDSDSVHSFVEEHRKEKFVFHFFITKEIKNIVLQKEINHYIGQYNGIFHTRIYTENERLISYYNSIGQPIELEHDYYDFDGIENLAILKQKELHLK